jgi:hypothetical protein
MCIARARGGGERSGGARADRPAKISYVNNFLAATPPKIFFGGGVFESASLGNYPPGDRSTSACLGDMSPRLPLCTRLFGQYICRAVAP